MCDYSPFAFFHSTQPASASDFNTLAYPQQRRNSTSISPKTSIYGPAGGRRGAIVACVEDHETQLEHIRRGSISTVFNTMSFQEKPQQLPMPVLKPSATYIESMLSPPSSPRSPPSPLHRHIELPEQEKERDYDERKFQRQIMSRLQALNHFQEEEVKVSESKFTPPPSPRPFMQLELPIKQSHRSGSGSGSKKRARSLKPANNALSVPAPLPSPSVVSSRPSKGVRRVSAPGTVTSATATSHKSARGAVKKVSSSTSNSRRGSSKGLEVLLEGTLFKSGWSWASAYENGSTATTEEGPKGL